MMTFYLGFYKLKSTSATRPARTGQVLLGARRPTSSIFCKSSIRRKQIYKKTVTTMMAAHRANGLRIS